MIHEYALDPEIVVEWAKDRGDFRYFYEQFGLGCPKLMAEFPKLKNWRKQFKQATANASDVELQRLTALFERFKEVTISRDSIDYDGSISWLENAIQEDSNYPFQSVLASQNPLHHNNILTNTDLEDDQHQKWTVSRSLTVGRIAAEMAGAVSPMLRNCRELILIDPYFRAKEHRFREPFTAFLAEFFAKPKDHLSVRVEVHSSADVENAPSAQFFHDECAKHLASIIPEGLEVVFRRWEQKSKGEKLHNRYILTELGGVQFGIGLDQGQLGETDDVSLMDRVQYELRWRQYASDNPAFEQAEDSFSVKGVKIFS